MWRNGGAENSIAICSPCFDARFRSLLSQETCPRSYADVGIISSISSALMEKDGVCVSARVHTTLLTSKRHLSLEDVILGRCVLARDNRRTFRG